MAGSGVTPSKPWDGTKEWLSQPVVASFIAGGMAGAVSRTVVSPLERLKILFQIQSVGREEYKMSIGKALGKMWREEGFRGFMAGNGTNCIRIVPYSAVQFGSYNFYKRVCIAPPAVVRGHGHLLTHSSSLRILLVHLLVLSSVCRVVPLLVSPQ